MRKLIPVAFATRLRLPWKDETHPMKTSILFAFLGLAFTATAGERGVINDPDGFSNLRAKPGTDSAIVAKIPSGQVFDFKGDEQSQWWKVTLGSGKTGYLHSSRIRFHATPDALKDTSPKDEINEYCKSRGIQYYPLARAAAKGEPDAMKRYFAIEGDGAAAETHFVVMCTVMHLAGDEKLAKFFGAQTAAYRGKIRDSLLDGLILYPFEAKDYMKRNFPKTAKLLLGD